MLRLAICLVILLFDGASYAKENQPHESRKASEPNRQQILPNFPTLGGAVGFPIVFVERPSIPEDEKDKTVWNSNECPNAKSHDEADLCEQRRMAKAADDSVSLNKIQIVLGAAGFLALLVTIRLSSISTNAAVKAADVAMQAIEDERLNRRAWLRLDLIPYREITYYDTGGFYTQMTVSITNIGQSVARDVRVWPKAFTHEGASTAHVWGESADWLFKRMAQRHPEERGRVILPNEVYSFEPDILIHPSEAVGSAKRRTGLIIRVAILAEYETDPVKGKRHTLTYFDVLGTSDGGVTRVLIPSEGHTPKERLRASKSSGGEAT